MGAAQGANIDTLNAAMPDELQAKVTADNWRNVKQTLAAIAARELVNIKSTTAISTTSATEATLPGFAAAFQSNGGLVQMSFKASSLVLSGTTLKCRMYLDNVEVDLAAQSVAGADSQAALTLIYQGVPPAGKHSVKITWLSLNAGTAVTMSYLGSSAILKVTEVRV